MIKIPQHTNTEGLVDILSIADVIGQRVIIEKWEVSVQWCIGECAEEIEKSAEQNSCEFVDADFRDFYNAVEQTIDGEFLAMARNGKIMIKVVDSSYWEIDSDIEGIEILLVEKYGKYGK